MPTSTKLQVTKDEMIGEFKIRELFSCIQSEAWDIKKKLGVSHKEAYAQAMEKATALFEPRPSADELSLAIHRWIGAQRQTTQQQVAQLSDGWYKVEDKHLRRRGKWTPEFEQYLAEMNPGDGRGKLFSNKKDAKDAQQAFASWARMDRNVSKWYDKNGTRRFKTNVTQNGNKWEFVVRKLK